MTNTIPTQVGTAVELRDVTREYGGRQARVRLCPRLPHLRRPRRGRRAASWGVQAGGAMVHYAHGPDTGATIFLGAGPKATRSARAGSAKPQTTQDLPDPESVAWQEAPDRWISITGTPDVTRDQLLGLVNGVRDTPPALQSPLKSARIPAGVSVATYTSEPETTTALLCPDPAKAAHDPRCLSLTIWKTGTMSPHPTGPDVQDSPGGPVLRYRNRTTPAYTIEVGSSAENQQAAQALLDSVELNG